MNEITVKFDLPDGIPDSFKQLQLNVETTCRLTAVDLRYSYEQRYSAEELKSKYKTKIIEIYKTTQTLNKELGELKTNLPAAIRMDALLGADRAPGTEGESVPIAKGEKNGHYCPILSCGKLVHKIYRHLEKKNTKA